MTDENLRKCKRKGCSNPVLHGKYCEHCKQIRKENKDKILKGMWGIAVLTGGLVIDKFGITQVPLAAAKVVKAVIKK